MGFELAKFDIRRVSTDDVTASVRKSQQNTVCIRIGGKTRIKAGFSDKTPILLYIDTVARKLMLARAEPHQVKHPSVRNLHGKSGSSVYGEFPINEELKTFFPKVGKTSLSVIEVSADRLIVKVEKGGAQ